MESPSKHPKQKLTLTEPFRLARHTFLQPSFLPNSPLKRFGLIGAGLLAGVSLPVLAIASQDMHDSNSSQTTNLHVSSSASPDTQTGEVFSTVEVNSTGTEDESTSKTTESHDAVEVTINGEPVPLVNGSAVQHTVNDDSSRVDIDIKVDNASISTSSSSSSTTDITIESNSSSSEDTNTTRGSPRR